MTFVECCRLQIKKGTPYWRWKVMRRVGPRNSRWRNRNKAMWLNKGIK